MKLKESKRKRDEDYEEPTVMGIWLRNYLPKENKEKNDI